jgi:hypothetical protein
MLLPQRPLTPGCAAKLNGAFTMLARVLRKINSNPTKRAHRGANPSRGGDGLPITIFFGL